MGLRSGRKRRIGLWLGAAPTALGILIAMFPSPYGLG